MSEPPGAAAGDPLARVLAIMQRLRDPEAGCPWDLAQSFATIAPYTIEEAYEVADAIDRADMVDLRDELGDLLFQVVFHARLAEEAGHFDFGDVAQTLGDKLLRRHPHVFAGTSERGDAAQVLRDWDGHKQREREAAGDTDASALAGIRAGLPEWQRALKLQKRAARTGFDWPDHRPVIAKLREELGELDAEFERREQCPQDPSHSQRLQEELGDVLFVVANLARHAGLDPGTALRASNAKFERRFRAMERLAAAEGVAFDALPLAIQERYWHAVKRDEATVAAADSASTGG